MAEYTANLNLLKKDPATDGNDTFNIKTMLNDNWDKIDDFAKFIENEISNVDDVETAVSNLIQQIGTLEELDTETKLNLVAAINELSNKKVDKVTGKGLSTNDYTDEEKQKLAGIEEEADKTTKSKIEDALGYTPLSDDELNDLAGEGRTTETVKSAYDLAQQAFQSASDGKLLISGAITGKGVPTAPDDTFQQMANNINAIETDKTGDATAVAADIRVGKTAYARGNKLVGTIPENTVKQTITTQGGQINLPEGIILPGSYVKAQFANLVPENIKQGINVGGVVGTYKPLLKHTIITMSYSSDYRDTTIDGILVGVAIFVTYTYSWTGTLYYRSSSGFHTGNSGSTSVYARMPTGQSNKYEMSFDKLNENTVRTRVSFSDEGTLPADYEHEGIACILYI